MRNRSLLLAMAAASTACAAPPVPESGSVDAQSSDLAPPAHGPGRPFPEPPAVPLPFKVAGATPAQLEAVLGAPADDEVRGTSRILDFHGRDCTLIVFFNLVDAEWRASQIVELLPDGDVADPTPCVKTIIGDF